MADTKNPKGNGEEKAAVFNQGGDNPRVTESNDPVAAVPAKLNEPASRGGNKGEREDAPKVTPGHVAVKTVLRGEQIIVESDGVFKVWSGRKRPDPEFEMERKAWDELLSPVVIDDLWTEESVSRLRYMVNRVLWLRGVTPGQPLTGDDRVALGRAAYNFTLGLVADYGKEGEDNAASN